MSKSGKSKTRPRHRKKKCLSPEIRKLSCKELEHFISGHCTDESCPRCKKVFKAYGLEPDKSFFGTRISSKRKKEMRKNSQTRLFQKVIGYESKHKGNI